MRKMFPFVAVLLGVCVCAPFAAAQGLLDKKDVKIYFGVDACKGCHSQGMKDDEISTSNNEEAKVWLTRDKHKHASLVLEYDNKGLNPRSKRMAEILGPEWKDLTKKKECVNCHGGIYIDTDNDPAAKKMTDPKTYSSHRQRVDSGVSCVACHGPNAKWIIAHQSSINAAALGIPEWNTLSKAQKVNEYGLADLFDPQHRAKLCFSCHIGDYDKERVVTHEMYAAGHPPLPGIEIATFSEAMPRHWETMSVKIARARRLEAAKKGDATIPNGLDFIRKSYDVNPDNLQLEQTRMVAITCLMAVRTSTDLLVNQAKAKVKEDELAKNKPAAKNGYGDAKGDARVASGDHWPHLASYDCYACHHDLATDSWRQKRGYDGKPGRIEIRPWSLALGRFGYDLASAPAGVQPGMSALDKAMTSWQSAFQKVPFGDPKTIILRGAELNTQLDAKIAELSTQKFDQTKGKEALRMLIDLAASQLYDFDSARQFAWALQTIIHEVQPNDKRALDVLSKLSDDLRLKLPEGPVPIEVDAVYGRISAYRPEPFQSKMRYLRDLMDGKAR
jgi:hypothetical protein